MVLSSCGSRLIKILQRVIMILRQIDEGDCTFAIGCDTCEDGVVINNDIDGDGVCDSDEIVGCTDSTAFNSSMKMHFDWL